ncbi:MAG: hypothetical protein ACREBU_10160, partial [Nitrososphaera sp.]
MSHDLIESILSANEITIVHPYSQSEIQIPTFGGTRLIAEQLNYLKENGNKIRSISLAEIGSVTSFLYRLQARLRSEARGKEGKNYRRSERRRWWLNVLEVLVNEYFPRLDIMYRHAVINLIKSLSHGSLLIYHYPYGANLFASCARKQGLKFVLYQHNIEWRFFEDRLGDGVAARIAISAARKIELDSVN